MGNPPYEALSKSFDNDGKTRLVEEEKRYKTHNANDLYTLFCEVALALARPNGGVVTMIVPLSIAFAQRKSTLRKAFEQKCKSVNLRYYDNIPDTIFNGTPVLKTWKNRQRTAIFTAVVGASNRTTFTTTGLQGWSSLEREQCIANRATNVLPQIIPHRDTRIAGQWPRIPSGQAASMVNAIIRQKHMISSFKSDDGHALAFPKIAYQFIGTVPKGKVSPRNESYLVVSDHDTLCLAMAALNGHVAYGWWWIFGDAFHINPYELTSFTIPDAWIVDPAPVIDLAQKSHRDYTGL